MYISNPYISTLCSMCHMWWSLVTYGIQWFSSFIFSRSTSRLISSLLCQFHFTSYIFVFSIVHSITCWCQSELPRPSPWSSVESDLGCALWIYFDNVTLTSQKPYQHNNKCESSKTNGYKWSLCFFFNKISLVYVFFIVKYKNFIYSADLTFSANQNNRF